MNNIVKLKGCFTKGAAAVYVINKLKVGGF